MLEAKIYVTLKKGILDPQGETVKGALTNLGFTDIKEVRIGKFMVIRLDRADSEEAKARVEEICRKLLANPVIEDYRFEIEEIQVSAVSSQPSVKAKS